MGVLADLKNEIESYPRDFLDLDIVDVDPAVGTAINRNEEISFRVRVTNRGPLHVRGLSLVVTGLNGTLVKSNGALAQFGSSFTTSVGYLDDVTAHQGDGPVTSGGGPFVFKATSSSSDVRDLVRVQVGEWDTDLDHILLGHSDPDSQASATYSDVVAAR